MAIWEAPRPQEVEWVWRSREELLKQVWGYSADMYTRTVDVHVASLRQKLEADPKQPKFILTVQGLGYKFKP